MIIPCQRDLFDLPADVTYLNCAYMGPLSQRVLTAGQEGLAQKAHPWNITPEDFFTSIEEVRPLFGQIIGGDSEGVALVPSVSYGMALAAANLPISTDSEIVVLAEQFPSNYYVWQELARRSDAVLKCVDRPANGAWTEALLEAVGPACDIIAVPPCHWTDGTIIDLEKVGERARQVGAALVVDGCQAIGALPVDVGRVEPDFIVTGAYKWLLGPYSQALLWVAPRWRTGSPLEHNWIIRANSRDFAGLVNYSDEFASGARRYDAGEVSNFALVPATLTALRQTLEWGVESVHQTLSQLTDRLAAGAVELGLGVAPKPHRAGHMIGLRLTGQDPKAIAAALAAARIHVSVRVDSIRVAPHLYNDQNDIDRCLEVLAEIIAAAGPARTPLSNPVPAS